MIDGEPRVFASHDIREHSITFRCFCGRKITIPSFGDQRTHHECGRTWWWADVNRLGMKEPSWWHVHTTDPDYCHGGAQQREDADIYLEAIREDFNHPDAILTLGGDPVACPHGADQPRAVLHGVIPR